MNIVKAVKISKVVLNCVVVVTGAWIGYLNTKLMFLYMIGAFAAFISGALQDK